VCTIGAGPRPGGAVIGDHVFIGCHASIIGAVTIGDDATVAANSLVISDVPAGCTAIGVPAKILPVIFRCSESPASVPSAGPEAEHREVTTAAQIQYQTPEDV
jgi:serine O-acetyltransferase